MGRVEGLVKVFGGLYDEAAQECRLDAQFGHQGIRYHSARTLRRQVRKRAFEGVPYLPQRQLLMQTKVPNE